MEVEFTFREGLIGSLELVRLVVFVDGREFFGVADVVFSAYGVEELFLVHEN